MTCYGLSAKLWAHVCATVDRDEPMMVSFTCLLDFDILN